jgi:CrcB protein
VARLPSGCRRDRRCPVRVRLFALQAAGGDDPTADEESEDDNLLQHESKSTDRRAIDPRARQVTTTVSSEPIDPELDPGGSSPSYFDIASAFVGGSLGTLARYGFNLGWPEGDRAVPHTTNVINTTGAFAVGIVATVLARRCPDRRATRAFLITGVLGGWTTMSALAIAEVRLASVGGIFTAAISIALSFALGVIAAGAGARLTRRDQLIDPERAG